MNQIPKNIQYYKFCIYGFLKNLRLFDVFFILFLKETGISYLQIGFLYSVRQFVINLFEVPSGIFADSFGRKKSLIVSLTAYLISFIIFYYSKAYFYFIVAMALYGLGEAFRSGTHKAIILQYLEKKDLLGIKTRFYGGTRSWSQLGSAVSSLLAMIVIFVTQNYRILFLLTAVPYFLNLINIASYPKNLDKGENASTNENVLRTSWEKIVDNIKEFAGFFKYQNNFRTLLSSAAFLSVFKTIKDYLQPILQTIAISLPVILNLETDQRTAIIVGISFFILYLLTSAASRNAWRMEELTLNLSKSIDIVYLTGIVSIGISGILLLLNLPAFSALVFVFLYIAQNVRRTLMLSYLSEIISSKIMASGLSTESQLQTILIVILAPIFGFLADWIGLSGALIIISILFIFAYPYLRLPIQTKTAK